jgi:hypothetical protein
VWYLASCTVYDATDVRQGLGSGLDADMLDGHDTSYFQVALGFTPPPNTRQVIAGAGLTGGGALSADLTLNVVANADGSIVVAADSIQVGVLATDAQHGTRGGGTLHAVVVAAGAAGFMSGADKTKLDGIATGAQVNDTAAQILAKLITVDGAGSGLDADLLDGLHAVSFASGVAAVSQTNFDLIKQPGLYQYDGTMTGTLPPIGSSNFRTVEVGSNARYSQIALPYNADGLCVRRMTDAAWSAWRTVLHDGNYNNYAPSLTGAGASGASWAIGITGNAATATKATATVTGTNSVELVRGNMADSDQFRILVGGTASNAGYAEIATADDGTEPIYVRQYTGAFAVIVRTATLLDGSGNTSFPGKVGIGCTPTDMLHVSGAGDVALRLQSTTPTTGRTFTIGSNGTGGLMVWDQTAGAGRLFIDSSGNVNVLGTLQEAGSRVWTAATLAGDRSNSQGFLTTTAASRLADLNSPPYGFSYWDDTSSNRPYGWGTLLSWAYAGTNMAVGGNWLFELGISTDFPPQLVFRNNINASGWSSWCRAWTDQTLTNLNQLTNGPGYITSVAGALGYTPVNKAGDTMTGALSVPTVTASAAGSSLAAEAWIALPTYYGWVTAGASYPPLGYYKDAAGIVHLRGVAKSGTSNLISILPAGYRPGTGTCLFATDGFGSYMTVTVDGTGAVLVTSVVGSVSLAPISFRAEQ